MFSLKQGVRLNPRISVRHFITSPALRVRKDENFTFDFHNNVSHNNPVLGVATFILQVDHTAEREREKFLKYKETFKLEDDPMRNTEQQRREYSVSKVTRFQVDNCHPDSQY